MARLGFDFLDDGGAHHSVALCGLAGPRDLFAGEGLAAVTRADVTCGQLSAFRVTIWSSI